MPKRKRDIYPSFSNLITYSIFKEPYKENKGMVYYFNNDVVLIRTNIKNIDETIYNGLTNNYYGIKIVHNGNLIIYTSHLTKEQFELIYNLIK